MKPSEEKIDAALNKIIIGYLKPMKTEDVCRIDGKPPRLVLGNNVMETAELRSLASEAKFLVETRLWSIFQETIRFDAFVKLTTAENMEQMRAGKMMLQNLNVIQGIVDNILKVEARIPPQPMDVSKSNR